MKNQIKKWTFYFPFGIALFFVFSFFNKNVVAQDVHFSQQRFSPLLVNPALAGLSGKYNALVNYRSQWNSVSSPYTTMAASFDTYFGPAMNRRGFLALGVNFFHDVAGDLKMTSMAANLSLAYHLRINEYNTIGLGIQAGYGSRGIGRIDGLFASQYDGVSFNSDIPSGEFFRTTNIGFFDIGSGIVYNYNSSSTTTFNSDGFQLSVGVAAYHLTKPDYSYLEVTNDESSIRFSAFLQSDFVLNNSEWSVMPGIYYQNQGKHQELLFGTYIKYTIAKYSNKTSLKEGFSIAYGPFYRWKDALVNSLLIEWSSFSIGFAYDVNLSTLMSQSRGRGGFELMLRYNLLESNQTRLKIR